MGGCPVSPIYDVGMKCILILSTGSKVSVTVIRRVLVGWLKGGKIFYYR